MGLLVAMSFLAFGHSAAHGQSMYTKINDFDGDGKADFAIIREEGGYLAWHIWRSQSSSHQRILWGDPTLDVNVPGDYDGDGRTDTAVMRRQGNGCVFHVLRSSDLSYVATSVPIFFESFCFPVQQDYDGDGKTDPAIKETGVTGRVSFRLSETNSNTSFEIPAFDQPVRVGDLDGGGTSEFGWVNFNRLVTFKNLRTGNSFTRTFGNSGDIFVPGDFDGDGIGELAVFSPPSGQWWWIRSSDSVVNVVPWGQNDDIPVPADYDGDHKTDLAVFRPGSPYNVYYILGSTNGFMAFAWGGPGDNVVRY